VVSFGSCPMALRSMPLCAFIVWCGCVVALEACLTDNTCGVEPKTERDTPHATSVVREGCLQSRPHVDWVSAQSTVKTLILRRIIRLNVLALKY
jgi:hypothetical protein